MMSSINSDKHSTYRAIEGNGFDPDPFLHVDNTTLTLLGNPNRSLRNLSQFTHNPRKKSFRKVP